MNATLLANKHDFLIALDIRVSSVDKKCLPVISVITQVVTAVDETLANSGLFASNAIKS
jgi:hypothetical protein